MFTNWIVAVLLGIGAHFSASFLVPLDEGARREFGGLLAWVWPWSYGDHGLLGRITQTPEGMPTAGIFIAIGSASLLIIALLGVMHWWVPFHWWRPAAIGGAALGIVLMLGFLGPTKILPILWYLLILYLLLIRTPELNVR